MKGGGMDQAANRASKRGAVTPRNGIAASRDNHRSCIGCAGGTDGCRDRCGQAGDRESGAAGQTIHAGHRNRGAGRSSRDEVERALRWVKNEIVRAGSDQGVDGVTARRRTPAGAKIIAQNSGVFESTVTVESIASYDVVETIGVS